MLADRIGAPIVLAAGTALTGLCYILAGGSAGFPLLVAALFLGGLGAATQHPIGSALVARAFEGARAITAIGTYNFAGDIGKMALPALAALLLWLGMSWRPTVGLLGALGLLAAVAIFTFLNGWNDFIGPLLYLNSPEKFTVAIGLATFRSVMRTRYDLLMAASAAMIFPVIVLFFFAQRYFIQGLTMGSGK